MAPSLVPDRLIDPPPAVGRVVPQLDPFVFPPETRGRFRMLVMAALVVGLNLAQGVVEVTSGSSDRAQFNRILSQSGGFKQIDPSHPDPAVLGKLVQEHRALAQASIGIVVSRLAIPAQTFALLAVLGVGLYFRHPRRIRRRHHPQALEMDQAPEVVGYLRRCVERLKIPRLRVEYGPAFGDGQAYGLRGREALLLFGAPSLLERAWHKMFKLIALHELGHVVNHDAAEREKARAVWKALLIVICLGFVILAAALAPGIASLAARSGAPAAAKELAKLAWKGLTLLWRLVPLLLVVRLIQAGLIRNREFYADWRVASWGFGDSLSGLLQRDDRKRESWWRRWWALHPSPRLRREVLADPRRLFRVSPALAFVTGVLLMVVFSSGFAPLVQLGLLVSLSGPLLAGGATLASSPSLRFLQVFLIQALPVLLFLVACLLTISYLVTAALGIQVQRAAVADLAGGPSRSGGYLRLFIPALLFSSGMEVGHLLSPFSPLPTLFKHAAVLPFWFGGFTLLVWFWLAYIRGATRLTLGLCQGSAPPRRRSQLIQVSAVLLLAILLWPAALARIVLMISPQSPPPWLTAGQDPWEHYVYIYAMTPMMFAVFAAVILLLWAGIGLIVASLSFARHRALCSVCAEPADCGFAVGRFCASCGSSLASWAYLTQMADPGRSEMEEDRSWTAPS